MNALLIVAAMLAAAPIQNGPQGIAPTGAEVELGRELFSDPLLSQDGTVSCSSCHRPDRGWSDGRPVAIGIRGQAGTRNSPTIINSSYSPLMFWDGRTVGADTQALLPLSNPIEMGNQSEADVLTKLRLTPRYVEAFAKVYGSIDPGSLSPITGPRLARAIAAFETTIVSFDAPIDRRLAGDVNALTPDAEIGFQIFARANCMSCHTPPLFTDNLFHNNGMEHAGKFVANDQGRSDVLRQRRLPFTNGDVRAFKTPTLREIARTAPYNHAGNFPDLKRVVTHYAAGGAKFDGTVDRFIDPRVFAVRGLELSETQQAYLQHFLETSFKGSPAP